MLSERARREMKEDAASATIRADFERLRIASRVDPSQPVDLDRVINFLSTMTRFGPPATPREPVSYSRVLL